MRIPLLTLLDILSPKSLRSRRIARDLAYAEGPRHRLDLYAPRGQGPWPVLVFFYGGSWDSGDRRDYTFVGRALAALGYLVAIPDYRIHPEVAFPAFLEDNARAVAWVVEHAAGFGGDPGRLALIGHSAGAYNAVMLALDRRYLTAAGVEQRPTAVVGLSGPYDFFPFDMPITTRTFGRFSAPAETQPVNLVSAAAPPMLLASGDRDQLVGPHNTRHLAARLREAGVPVVEKHYPQLDHTGPLLELGSLLGRRTTLLPDIAGFLRAELS